jgi:putative transposase
MADFLYTLKKSVTNRALTFVRANAPDFLAQMADRQPNGKLAHRFWRRGGGYDENLYNPGKIWQKIDYIHGNPVRRGLCESPTDWPWSSARAYETRRPDPIRIDFDSLPIDRRAAAGYHRSRRSTP